MFCVQCFFNDLLKKIVNYLLFKQTFSHFASSGFVKKTCIFIWSTKLLDEIINARESDFFIQIQDE